MNLRDLMLRVRALLSPRRVERELHEELAFHIDRETEKYVRSGLTREEARTRAQARFGSVALAADRCRDERGTGLVETTVRDVLYAFRMFRRAPLAAVTIVATVALGLGLVAAVFTFFSTFLFRVDAVRNPGELFAVERPSRPGSEEQVPFTRPEYDALRRDTSVFSDVVAVLRGVRTRIDGRVTGANLVTGNFFHVLGVQAALGRTLTPADDERSAGRAVIVLSHKGWSRRFASDPAVVGRTVLINGFPFEIVGVAPDGFRGLSIGAPDYWAPLALVGQFRRADAGREDQVAIEVIGRLKPGVSPETAAAGLTVWAAAHREPASAGTDPAAIRLEHRRGTTVDDLGEVLLVLSPIFFAFGLILAIGCANVANLLLARGIARQREIGVRLSLGASRWRIVRQLLTESLLLALAAAACGFAMSRIVLAATLYAATATMPSEIAEGINISVPVADWRVVLFLLAGAIASTVFFGLAPALQATRLELVRTMRGEVTRDARPGRARNALIAAQVGASALLLICAALFLRSAFAVSSAELGLRTVDTLSVDIASEPLRAAVVSALHEHPAVAAVAASRPQALVRPGEAFASASTRRVPVGYRYVSPEYFAVLDIPVLRGRGFTQAEPTGAAVAVVSETTARELWPDGAALGQVLHVQIEPPSDTPRAETPALPSRPFTVVGVVGDVPGLSFGDWPLAGVYLPATVDTADTTLTLRVRGDADQARAALLERLTAIDPAFDQISTLRTMAGLGTYLLGMAFWVTVVLAALALVLTLSGLFSVLSYVVEQRAKEIGVRMALGATTGNVTRLVLSQLLRQVAVGVAAGAGLAAALSIVLLSTPLAVLISGVVDVFDPVAYAASLLCIVPACLLAAWVPAQRAARIDPLATLRQD